MEEDNFVLTFTHRVQENPEISIFYAFTYPFTCTELEEYLQKLDRKHKKSSHTIDLIIQNIKNENDHKKKTVIINKKKDDDASMTSKCDIALLVKPTSFIIIDEENGNNCAPSELIKKIEQSDSIYGKNTNVLENYEELQNIEQKSNEINNDFDNFIISKSSSMNLADCKEEIYFYRELLINSLQGRRVDFLTITSFHGITDEREPRLENLFPDLNHKRCHIFEKKKVCILSISLFINLLSFINIMQLYNLRTKIEFFFKIIFLSSRVHPGETPASFVLNGFINCLLDKKSAIAAKLRFVFLIIS